MRLERTAVIVLVAASVMMLYHWWHQETGDGTHTIVSSVDAPRLVERLTAAIKANDLTTSIGACGKCGVETIDIDDENTTVITVTGRDLMMRLLKAGASAGLDPPLRFYVTPMTEGGSRLVYHQPSEALAIYEVESVVELGKQLDPIFEMIARQAVQP